MSILHELDGWWIMCRHNNLRHQYRRPDALEPMCLAAKTLPSLAVALQGQLVSARSLNRREHGDMLTYSRYSRLSVAIRNAPMSSSNSAR